MNKDLQINILIDALKTIRQNRRNGDWEYRVIQKTLKMINDPGQFNWDHVVQHISTEVLEFELKRRSTIKY